MINLRPEIVQALENKQELVYLLGGKRVQYRKAKNAEEFPRITFFELDNRTDGFADNDESESEITFQIDLGSKGSTRANHQKVNKDMKSIGFSSYKVYDIKEDCLLQSSEAAGYYRR